MRCEKNTWDHASNGVGSSSTSSSFWFARFAFMMPSFLGLLETSIVAVVCVTSEGALWSWSSKSNGLDELLSFWSPNWNIVMTSLKIAIREPIVRGGILHSSYSQAFQFSCGVFIRSWKSFLAEFHSAWRDRIFLAGTILPAIPLWLCTLWPGSLFVWEGFAGITWFGVTQLYLICYFGELRRATGSLESKFLGIELQSVFLY